MCVCEREKERNFKEGYLLQGYHYDRLTKFQWQTERERTGAATIDFIVWLNNIKR